MNKIFRKIIICLLSAMLLVSLAACDNTPTDDKRVVTASRTAPPTPKDLRGIVKISGYRSAKYDDSIMDFIAQVALDYPGLEVEYDDNYTEEEYFATLDERVASGDIGDLYLVRDTDLAAYAEKNYVLDLTDYASNFHDYSNSQYIEMHMADEVFPAAYSSAQYQGRLYMVPTEYNHKYVFLNYTLLERAGIETVPNDKWTWEDFKHYASAVTSVGGKIVMDYTDYAVWGAFINGAGGSVFAQNEDGTLDPSKISLTDGAALSGLNELLSFIRSNNVQTTLGNSNIADVGIAVVDRSEMGVWQNTAESEYFDWSLVDVDWDFMHFPRFTTHSVGAHTVGFAVKNTSNSNDEHKELCANIALYMLFDLPSQAYTGNGEIVPANIKVSDMKFWREYPVKGKNTSVFTNYYASDFSASLTSVMNLSAAKQMTVGSALEQAKSGADITGLLRSIESAANNAMNG